MRPEERAARDRIADVRNPEREGWTCQDCDGASEHDYPYGLPGDPVRWLWRNDDGGSDPLCDWHAEERVHEALPYETNCTRCGIDHSALWPSLLED